MTLAFVLIAYRLDLAIGTTYIKDAVIIAFITNELISLIENAGLMGIELPDVLVKAIDVLQKKSESKSESEDE
jgi:toxin secretion/phage lysis holin